MLDYLPLVIAGEVDHGKSTLIGRLLYETGSLPQSIVDSVKAASALQGVEIDFAFFMDHFSEEREKRITIDTSQILFSTDSRQYLIIDAPGHLDFLKNMITGSSQADAALLVIDAHEGLQDQTKRHAYLLKLLGIPSITAVINKMDRVGYSKETYERVCNEVRSCFEELKLDTFAKLDFVPISALTGQNIVEQDAMPWYSGPCLVEALDRIKERATPEQQHLRLSVQDNYDCNGTKVYAARVEAGVLNRGAKYRLMPSNQSVELGNIYKFTKDGLDDGVTKAQTGECVAVSCSADLKRGDILCEAEGGTVSDQIETDVFWMSKDVVCRPGDAFTFKLSSQASDCFVETIVSKLDPAKLKENLHPDSLQLSEVGRIKIALSSAVMVDRFSEYAPTGRFVLEKEGVQVAGGTIR